ncbi:MAG: thiolase family protein [Bacteriovoracaceae bacterium]|nr:thiolase family protein [Bacteriovoracaceae bacterium]
MEVYLSAGQRTAIGSFMGSLAQVSAPKLGAVAIEAALKKAHFEKNDVQEVFMGHVVQAGVGQAPARQAALFAGLSDATPCTTVNKVCGSGLQAVILAAKSIMLDGIDVAIAGGMENMSLAPGLLPFYRSGFKFGTSEIKDSMQWDGLWDVYSNRPMGNCAEEAVKKYNLTREAQDEFAINSFKRALEAQKNGSFQNEISAVVIKDKKGDISITSDEGPSKVNFEKLPKLSPAFEKDGSITAANASTINDGAAAIVLTSAKHKSKAQFRIVGWASHAQAPTWFTTAPVEAMKKNLRQCKLNISQIDLFEINEAFACVTMVAMKELEIPSERVNIFGGAIALGHPIGCSGTRILVTLMNAMEKKAAKMGCAAICIGGGEALSIIIERV